jgi:hypothetical protein
MSQKSDPVGFEITNGITGKFRQYFIQTKGESDARFLLTDGAEHRAIWGNGTYNETKAICSRARLQFVANSFYGSEKSKTALFHEVDTIVHADLEGAAFTLSRSVVNPTQHFDLGSDQFQCVRN